LSTVDIGGLEALVSSWSDSSITVELPLALSNGFHNVVVNVAGETSAPLSIEVTNVVALSILSTNQTFGAGTCSGAITVEFIDPYSVAAPIPASTTLNLATIGGVPFSFYSDPGCSVEVTNLGLFQGQQSAEFYLGGTLAGSGTFEVSESFLTAVTQEATVVAGSPAKIAFVQFPDSGVVNQSLFPAPVVEVQDAYGNLVPYATDNISLVIQTNPGGAILTGTTNVSAVGGAAFFADVKLDKPGIGYTLAATGGVLSTAFSVPFNINPAIAAKLRRVTPAVANAKQGMWHWVYGDGMSGATATARILTDYGAAVTAVTTTTLSNGLVKFYAPVVYPGRHQLVLEYPEVETASTIIPFPYQATSPAEFSDALFTAEVLGAMRMLGFEQDKQRYIFVCTDSTAPNRLYRVDGTRFYDESSRIPATVFDCSDAGLLDVNNDGRIDIMMSGFSVQNQLWVQQANGTFADMTATAIPAETDHSWGIGIADFNLDGFEDILVANSVGGGQASRGYTKLYVNQGNGTFSIGSVPTEVDDVGRPAVGDFTGDGYPDVILPVTGGQSLFWRNDGAGNLVDDTLNWMPDDTDYDYPVAVAGDFFNSGRLDVMMGGSLTQTVIYQNTGSGFNVIGAGPLPTATYDTWGLSVGDVNGDGWLDAALANGYSSGESDALWLNNGDGTFRQEILAGGAATTLGIDLYDVDGDADLDLLIANDEVAPLIYENRFVAWRDDSALQSGTPSPRWGAGQAAALFYDPLAGFAPSMFVLGGMDASPLGDVYTLRLTDMVWEQRCTGAPCLMNAPSARAFHAAAYHPYSEQMVVFGDDLPSDSFVYHYGVTGDVWTVLDVSGPAPRREHTLTYMPEIDRMVLVGGDTTGAPTISGEWWFYDVWGSVWEDKTTGGTPGVDIPTARKGHAAAAGEGKLFVFGGYDGVQSTGDIWALEVTTNTWTQVADTCISAGCPGGRMNAMMVYLPSKRWLVVAGDTESAGGVYAYDLSNDSWQQLCLSGCEMPPEVSYGFHIWDPLEHALLWWGGATDGGATGAIDETWRLFLK
jgi:hypothetical protein